MPRLGYVPALDGLRAVAITLVVGKHAFGFPAGGAYGVDLFFVLSGFLITTLLLEEHVATGRVSFLAFWRRRALRLVPALVVMLAVFLPVSLVFFPHGPDDFESSREIILSTLAGSTYVVNIVSASGYDVADAVEPLWSLAAEEQFYLLWPVLLFVVLRGRVRLALGVLLGALAAWQAWGLYLLLSGAGYDRLRYGPDTRSGSIIVGCLLALGMVKHRETLLRWGAVAVVPALAVFSTLALVELHRERFAGPFLLFAIACAIVVAAAMKGGWFAAILSLAPFVFLGRISYALYLWHAPFLVWLDGRSEVLAVALALTAAIASYYLVERPFLRRKHRSAHSEGEQRKDLTRCDGRGHRRRKKERRSLLSESH